MSVAAHQKNYLADKKPFFKHFYPKDVTITAVRTVAIQGLMVFSKYVEALERELEESDEDLSDADDDDAKKAAAKPEFVAPSLEEFGAVCTKSFVKSVSITTFLRSLEEVSLRCLRPQVVGKLVKDVSRSATRKYMRTTSRFAAATLMVKTGMRANILSHVAIFLVEETHQLILILYRRFTAKSSKKKTTGKHLRTGDAGADEPSAAAAQTSFAEVTLRNASRSGLAIVTGGVGAAIGTLIRPGLGTIIGGTIGDTIAYVV
ncbi:hypothetical protein PybrP1_009775 [[Pythium] brassicae (nom. inval.)]|nr:hypothetical protein PybrP1_009775 [[Pythium] brassicae (nom. inval.)]